MRQGWSARAHQATAGWLTTLLNIAVRESGSARAGSENVLSRLSELMFVEVIRRYIEGLPAAETGWLAGLRDPVIGQALAAIHGDPAESWTVERLARLVGVSRSVFAERFVEMVGRSALSIDRAASMPMRHSYSAETPTDRSARQ